MDISAHKGEIETRIVETMIAALDKKELAAEEVSVISSYVLDRIDTITTQEEFMEFLRGLASKWSIFTPVLVLESGEAKEQKEDQVAKDVLALAKEKKIDEAVKLAKTATQGQ